MHFIFYLLAAFEHCSLLAAPDRNNFHSPKPIKADITVFQLSAVYMTIGNILDL
nr:MAG TPA_asm: hypothetical protein [Caudoviricetes sp.]DAL67182.1 MAG TPA: hypothetical protein [Caudoviricetes sp.]DAR98991.1 MAG TPA: hypothetical protein [Caudoviricetes sp.]DAT47741.1 MAG TPA: hypothetical protein [Bacteriophage sp.]DAV04918.1 MAG TPA: hypothetical protein [Caudoviricetes sp.]